MEETMDKPGEYTDTELLKAFQLVRPPDEAIRHLYSTCFPMARDYVIRNNGTQEDAEDIFQEVVISFIEWVQNGKFRADSSISSFLYAVNRHLWLNELRRKGRARKREARFDREQDAEVSDLNELLAGNEFRAQVFKMIDTLGETCKKILLTFYYDGLPMREILQLLDYQNEQVLRNKKYKCMQQLEQQLTGKTNLLKYFKSVLYHE